MSVSLIPLMIGEAQYFELDEKILVRLVMENEEAWLAWSDKKQLVQLPRAISNVLSSAISEYGKKIEFPITD